MEAIYTEHGKVLRYEFEGRQGAKNRDLEVSADGSRILEANA